MTHVRLRRSAIVIGAITALTAPALLPAQPLAGLSAALEIAPTRLARTTTASRVLSGPIIGAQGRIAFRLIEIEGRYGEGSLSPAEGTTGLAEDLVEGAVVAWYRPRSWVAIGAGPQLRAFISPSGTAHWVRFDLRARFESDLIPGLAIAHAEGWLSASATTNVQGGGAGAQGAEAGLTVRIPRLPVSARLGYIADRASFTNGGTEFVEGIRLSLLMGPF
jgi:hypothetical protein